MPEPTLQRCPNCGTRVDVSIYVSGQRARCDRCGIRFAVERATPAPEEEAGSARRRAEAERPEHSDGAAPGVPSEILNALQTPAEAAIAKPPIASDRARNAADARAASSDPEATAPPPAGSEPTLVRSEKPTLPGYKLLELLGRGGMGEVYRAQQISLGREVAVKVLPAETSGDPDFVRRFEQEATSLAALKHPNIVGVIDRGMGTGSRGEPAPYIVMELVEGRSLREQLVAAGGALSPADALSLMVEVARAIAYAHGRGIIHRDLKPENILLDTEHGGRAKVADFGLAGMTHKDEGRLTGDAVAMGTAHYMAPEQRRDARNVDGRADLYSLGVILYEALTGDLPSGRFALPSERIRGLPRVVDAVVLKLLESEPERRHPDANAAAAAIEESLLQTSGKSLRRSAPPGARKWGWAGAAGGLGAAALLVAGVALVLGRGAAAAPRSVRLAAEVKRPAADRVQVAFGVAGPDKSPGPVYAVGGGWRAEDGVLYRSSSRGSVEAETTRAPRAYLTAFRADFADAQIEVEASLGEGGVAGEAPAADLVLYRDRARWVGVVVSLGEDSGYALAWPGGSAEGAGKAEEPQPGRVVKLGLRLKGQKAAALVDGRVVATATVPALAGVKGKVGVGCRAARCSFHGLEVRGPILEPPAREALP